MGIVLVGSRGGGGCRGVSSSSSCLGLVCVNGEKVAFRPKVVGASFRWKRSTSGFGTHLLAFTSGFGGRCFLAGTSGFGVHCLLVQSLRNSVSSKGVW